MFIRFLNVPNPFCYQRFTYNWYTKSFYIYTFIIVIPIILLEHVTIALVSKMTTHYTFLISYLFVSQQPWIGHVGGAGGLTQHVQHACAQARGARASLHFRWEWGQGLRGAGWGEGREGCRIVRRGRMRCTGSGRLTGCGASSSAQPLTN